MAFLARELTVAYGGVTVGGASQVFVLLGGYTKREAYRLGSFTCRCLVRGATQAAFRTNEASLTTAWTKPYQDLAVQLGGSNVISWSHGSNTGFNGRPELEKVVDSPYNTGTSAEYELRLEVDLPADLSGDNAFDEVTVALSATPSGRRSVIISGIVTATGATAARAQFDAEIDDFADTELDVIDSSATWELVDRDTEDADQKNKIIAFSRTYEERVFNQSSGTLDDANIVGEQLSIARRFSAPGDSNRQGNLALEVGPSERLAELQLAYSCGVPKATTDLDNLYTATIRPHIITQALAQFSASSGAIVDEQPTYDPVENRLNVAMLMMVPTGSTLLRVQWTKETERETGANPVPVWSGSALGRVFFQGPETRIQTITQIRRRLSGAGSGGTPGSTGGGGGVSTAQVFGAEPGGILSSDPELGIFTSDFGQAFGEDAFGGLVTGIGSTLQFTPAPQPSQATDIFGGKHTAQDSQGGAGGAGGGAGGGVSHGGLSAAVIFRREKRTPLRLGRGAYTLDVVDEEIVQRALLYQPVTFAGAPTPAETQERVVTLAGGGPGAVAGGGG